MKLPLVAGALLAAAIAGSATAATPVPAYFPNTFAGNSLGQPNSSLQTWYGGVDSQFHALGNGYVTFDLGEANRVRDGAGQDFNVYEYNSVGSGSAEYGRLNVFVSDDNVNFFNIDSTIGDPVAVIGIADAGVPGSYRSFDVGGAVAGLGVSSFRYIKLQGVLNGAVTDGFDLNAVGVVNFGPAAAVPEPATWAMMIAGFGLAGTALRRRRVAIAA